MPEQDQPLVPPVAPQRPARRKLNRSVTDAILIVFSVLLALMLNKTFDAYQERKKRDAAEAAIRSEISVNTGIVAASIKTHLEIQERLTSLVEGKGDSILNLLRQKKYFDFWIVAGDKSFQPKFPSSTAWETTRATGIISDFDYHRVEQLTDIYNQQDIIYNGTLGGIVNMLYDRKTNDLKNLEETLIELKLRFDEMILQEKTLEVYYADLK